MASPTLNDSELKEKYGLRFPNPEDAAGVTIFDEPFELGYKCPKGHANITWSEFKEHIWCYDCKLDYLSFECPIKRPCWMNKEIWNNLYGNHADKFNIKLGRIHPYSDCRQDGKLHKCVK